MKKSKNLHNLKTSISMKYTEEKVKVEKRERNSSRKKNNVVKRLHLRLKKKINIQLD